VNVAGGDGRRATMAQIAVGIEEVRDDLFPPDLLLWDYPINTFRLGTHCRSIRSLAILRLRKTNRKLRAGLLLAH